MQLPVEILETLSHSNYLCPSPRQTEPGVLYDLLKIRRLVDEASDLAVRAQNGTASSALTNDTSLPGGALGLSYRSGGANAKLSPERKYRMRELAVQKLATAYRLDEIAASVAAMQGASALDTIASFVLQRSPNNAEAKYVNFFHERIPSRMMAEFTPLTPLDELIALEPGHAPSFRTRAIAKIFKEDYVGAVQDLTEALQLCRLDQAKHRAGKNQLVTLAAARAEAEKRTVWSRDWLNENRVAEDDQPKGLELQLLFQRGNQYLTLACRQICKALHGFRKARDLREEGGTTNGHTEENHALDSFDAQEAYDLAFQARELVRKYAKRAQRDYVAFFAHLDYAYAENDAYFRMYDQVDEAYLNGDRVVEDDGIKLDSQSGAMIRQSSAWSKEELPPQGRTPTSPPPPPATYTIAEILTETPPTGLPRFPPSSTGTMSHFELVAYHPLLSETMNSFLLAHAILQTPPTTLNRLANNVATIFPLDRRVSLFPVGTITCSC